MGRLVHLIQRDHWEEIRWLLVGSTSSQALVSELACHDRLGRTPLHYACAKRYAPARVVATMLEQAPEEVLKQRDVCGNTLLHAAAACGNAHVARVLLERLLRPHDRYYTNDKGLTPLMMAWRKHLDSSFTLFGDVQGSGRVSPIVSENIRLLNRVRSVAELQATERLCDLWDKTCVVCYHAATEQEAYPLFGGMLWRPIHVLATVGGDKRVRCPTVAMWFALRLYPDEVRQRDERGNLPLHLAAMHHEWPPCTTTIATTQQAPVLVMLVRAYPSAARTINPLTKRLPLHLAIAHGKSFAGGIQALVGAAPESLERRDPVTKLYPYQQAACTPASPLTVVYELLRTKPDMLRNNTPSKKRRRGE